MDLAEIGCETANWNVVWVHERVFVMTVMKRRIL
jgi:hypothetical protein